jgi:hypothetical protein
MAHFRDFTVNFLKIKEVDHEEMAGFIDQKKRALQYQEQAVSVDMFSSVVENLKLYRGTST